MQSHPRKFPFEWHFGRFDCDWRAASRKIGVHASSNACYPQDNSQQNPLNHWLPLFKSFSTDRFVDRRKVRLRILPESPLFSLKTNAI
jgi:hypothetical protein